MRLLVLAVWLVVAVLPGAASAAISGRITIAPAGLNSGLGTIAPDGSDFQPLANVTAKDIEARWSPDGTKVALRRIEWSPQFFTSDVYVQDADGANSHLVSSGYSAPMDWSADGRRLLYSGGGTGSLWTVDPDGGNPQEIPGTQGFGSAAWSPDGRSIAYMAYDPTVWLHSGVWTMNPDGTHQRRLTPNDHGVLSLSWSPDSSKIIYQSGSGVTHGVWQVNADGSNDHPLIVHEPGGGRPLFSPDGTAIAYAAYDGGRIHTYLANADGGNRRVIFADSNPQDWTGVAPARDSDGDGIADDADNCPDDANATQSDDDSDGIGDACDSERAAPYQLEALIETLESLDVAEGLERSLIKKLRDALDAAMAANPAAACRRVRSFINEVRAQSGQHLSTPDAAALLAAADGVLRALNCAT